MSPRTIEFYTEFLSKARRVIGIEVTSEEISLFLKSLKCKNGGKHGYYRVLRCFYNWLYSPRSGYNLNVQDNPMLRVQAPKLEKTILPSLTCEQVEYLIEQAGCVRDKAIISLFADSGLRLTELANIEPRNIDWDNRLIKVRCKGNKEGFAPFGTHTQKLLKEYQSLGDKHNAL